MLGDDALAYRVALSPCVSRQQLHLLLIGRKKQKKTNKRTNKLSSLVLGRSFLPTCAREVSQKVIFLDDVKFRIDRAWNIYGIRRGTQRLFSVNYLFEKANIA